MEPQDLAATYRSKTDEELLELAEHSSQLTPQALAALTSELSGRKLPAPSVRNADAQIDPIMGPSGSKDIGGVAEFLKDVLNVYHRHFWAFIQLTVPAVILGYLAVTVARTQVRAIGSHLPHGVDVLSHRFELLVEIPVINGIGYFISWMGFCFSYAAVCSAVNQIENGLVPSIADCIAAAGKRLTVFFRLCIGLFLLLMITVSLGGLAEAFIFWALSREHLRLGPVAIWLLTYLFFFGCALVLSRLSLAIPSVVLDGYTVAKALSAVDRLLPGLKPCARNL